jgi:class 3 adenylate cyclase/hemoglobin-like flavoprotein
MAKIFYTCDERAVPIDDPHMTILDISIAHKIPHFRECGGHARCTTCRVRILDGMQHVSPRTPREAWVAQARNWDAFTRLACQTRVTGDVTIQRLIKSGAEVARLQLEEILPEQREEKSLAILFCDIRDFTPFVAHNLPYDVVHMLNRFFTKLGEPILLNNGVIYQYVGDEITGLFGVGGDPAEKSCLDAIRAGLGMLEALQDLNTELSIEFGTTFDIGIGAHFGRIIVGQVGHPSHRQFAVIGDAINIASRIQGMNKTLGTKFLVSEALFTQIPHAPVDGRQTQAILKGKDGTFKLMEVLGFTMPDPTLLVQETVGILLQQQERFTTELYQRLFTLAPAARTLFRGNLQSQGQMLAHMLQILVYAMSRPDSRALGLRDLGQRHVGYGVAADHYPILRQAFLDTVRVMLGEKHTPQVEKAWASTIDTISKVMLSAAHG